MSHDNCWEPFVACACKEKTAENFVSDETCNATAAGGQATSQANKGKKNRRSPDKTKRKRGKVFAKAESIHDIYRGQFLDVDGIELPSPLRAGSKA